MDEAPRFDIIDHTADTGVRVRGRDKRELLVNGATAMMSLMVDLSTVTPVLSETIKLEAPDFPELLVAWLNEIIFLVDARGELFSSFTIESLTDTSLEARAEGEKIDLDKHELRTQIKACTYHGLLVGKEETGLFAQVIFDV